VVRVEIEGLGRAERSVEFTAGERSEVNLESSSRPRV
jgi:hypothetical protein